MKKNIIQIIIIINIFCGYVECMCGMNVLSRIKQRFNFGRVLIRDEYGAHAPVSLPKQKKLPKKPEAGFFWWIKKTQANLSTFPKFSSGSRVVELLDKGVFPSYYDVENIENETGFLRGFFLKNMLNQVDDNGETLMGKAIGLIIQDIANISDEKIEVIKKLYALGARLGPEELSAFQKHFPETLRRVISNYTTSYRNIKIGTIHNFAHLIALMSHIGIIPAELKDIDMHKVAFLDKISTFSSAVSSKSINQIGALSQAQKRALFNEDIRDLRELGVEEMLCTPNALINALAFINIVGADTTTTGFLKGILKLSPAASAIETKEAFINKFRDNLMYGSEEQKKAANQFLENLDQDIKEEEIYKVQRISRE